MKDFTWIIFSIVITFSACSKEDCLPRNGLTGTWELEQSVGGFAGWTLTPESEGYSQKIVIDDIFFSTYRNDSLLLKREYEAGIEPDSLRWSPDSTFLEVEGYPFRMSYHIENDILTLNEQCSDCFVHSYRRSN